MYLLCRWCSVTEQFSIWWLSTLHLSKWAWSKGYNWHSKVRFLLNLHLEIGNWRRLITKLYGKLDDFTFPIVNIPFISSKFPALPAYRVYISQLIHFSRLCPYIYFLDRAQLTQKLFKQVYVTPWLKVIATTNIRVSYKSKARLILRQHMLSHPVFGGVRIADLLSFLYCVVFFVCLRHVYCEDNVASDDWLSVLERTFGFLWCLLWIFFIHYLMKL